MFRNFITDATAAADSVVARAVAQALIAVPFLIAFGFATAGVALMLVDRFGHRDAYLILAAGFSVIGVLTIAFIRNRQSEAAIASASAHAADVGESRASAASDQLRLPLAALAALASSSVGPALVARLARGASRNLPIVGMALVLGFLMWPKETETATSEESTADDVSGGGNTRPNGAFAPDHHGGAN